MYIFHKSCSQTSVTRSRSTVSIQARVQEAPRGLGPPPRNCKAKKGHQSEFQAISPIFCYFFSRKYHFLCYFLSWISFPLEKLKKKGFQIFAPPPPLQIPGHATGIIRHLCYVIIN